MADKLWKQAERKVAAFFGTTRTPLSGRSGKITGSDTLHRFLFIEVKSRKRWTILSLWDKIKREAKKEGKIPILAICQKGRHGSWFLVHSEDLVKIFEEIK